MTLDYMLIAIGVAVIYIVYYIFSKDIDTNKNLRAIASAVEDANRQIYMLEKKIFNIEKKLNGEKEREMNDEEIYQEIERSVYDIVNPISLHVNTLSQDLSDLATVVDTRLINLEGGIKQISMPSSVYGNDDNKIISLFKNGREIDAICKELHLSKTEVEFVLKINKLR